MTVAWNHIILQLRSHVPLVDWTLPAEQCFVGAHQLIPASVWQAALPALRAVLAARVEEDKEEWRQRVEQLRQWVEQPQPTKWVPALRDSQDRLREAADQKEQAGDVKRMEVLRDIDRREFERLQPELRDVEVRCRLVLQACPYLQHLVHAFDPVLHVEPSHEDTFALLSRLRSLFLYCWDNSNRAPELVIDTPPVDFERMLDSLPRLTSLRCRDVFISFDDLLVIASHSTLEDVEIRAEGKQLADKQWIGDDLRLPADEKQDVWQLEQPGGGGGGAGGGVLDGIIEEEEKVAAVDRFEGATGESAPMDESDENAPAWTRDDVLRMQAALARTQPTRRSCEKRLALADWLHRRLRRGGLHNDGSDRHVWLLRHYRRQVALLRSTLQRQLSELAVVAPLMSSTAAAREHSERMQWWLEQFRDRYEKLDGVISASERRVSQREECKSDLLLLLSRLRYGSMNPTERFLANNRRLELEASIAALHGQASAELERWQLSTGRVKAMLTCMQPADTFVRPGSAFDIDHWVNAALQRAEAWYQRTETMLQSPLGEPSDSEKHHLAVASQRVGHCEMQ